MSSEDNLSSISDDVSSQVSTDSGPLRSALKTSSAPKKKSRDKRASFADSSSGDDSNSNFSSNNGDDGEKSNNDSSTNSNNTNTDSGTAVSFNTRKQEFLAKERAMNKGALEKKGSSSNVNSAGRAVPNRYLSARCANWCETCIPSCLSQISPTTMMVILFCIPVIFLVVFLGIPLGESIRAVNYLQNHVDAMRDILFAAARGQEERRDSSLYLASTPNTTVEANAIVQLAKTRRGVDDGLNGALKKIVTSDGEYASDILSEIQRISNKFISERRAVDTRTTSGASMRENLLIGVDEIYALILLIAKDPRVRAVEVRFKIFIVLGRIANSYGLTRAIGTALVNRDGNDADQMRQMFSVREAAARDYIMAKTTGDDATQRHLDSWISSSLYHDFNVLADKLQSGDVAQITSVTLQQWLNVSNTFVRFLETQDAILVEDLTSGNDLRAIAIAEGMKMFGAVLACALAGIFVIWFNNREQAKLEHALSNTRVLARAVQRFVPKNQLRTMGVRSITEVQPGMSTEVASVLLTAGIRNFSDLSRTMNNTQLFDWIQKYMSRMTNVTQSNSGFIDKVIADTAYAVFSVSKNAVQSAIAMQVVTDQLNSVLVAQCHDNFISVGIGIHLCPVVTGVYGDSSRLSVAMVSNDVMLASRLESMTKSFGAKILASEAVVSQIAVAKSELDQRMYRSTSAHAKKRKEKARAKERAELNAKKLRQQARQEQEEDNNNNETTTKKEDQAEKMSDDNRNNSGSDGSLEDSAKNSSNEDSDEGRGGGDDDGGAASPVTSKQGFQLRLVGTVVRLISGGSDTSSGVNTSNDSNLSPSAKAKSSGGSKNANKPGVYKEHSAARDNSGRLDEFELSDSSGSMFDHHQGQQTGTSADTRTSYSTSTQSTIATIDIYDIFQADDLSLKNFKLATKYDFEVSVRQVLNSYKMHKAEATLNKLYAKSRKYRVRDTALERTLRAVRRNTGESAVVITDLAERDAEAQIANGEELDGQKKNSGSNSRSNRGPITSNNNNNNNNTRRDNQSGSVEEFLNSHGKRTPVRSSASVSGDHQQRSLNRNHRGRRTPGSINQTYNTNTNNTNDSTPGNNNDNNDNNDDGDDSESDGLDNFDQNDKNRRLTQSLLLRRGRNTNPSSSHLRNILGPVVGDSDDLSPAEEDGETDEDVANNNIVVTPDSTSVGHSGNILKKNKPGNSQQHSAKRSVGFSGSVTESASHMKYNTSLDDDINISGSNVTDTSQPKVLNNASPRKISRKRDDQQHSTSPPNGRFSPRQPPPSQSSPAKQKHDDVNNNNNNNKSNDEQDTNKPSTTTQGGTLPKHGSDSNPSVSKVDAMHGSPFSPDGKETNDEDTDNDPHRPKIGLYP